MGHSHTSAQYVHYTPGEYVIYVFGGVSKLARLLLMEKSSVSRWQRPRKNNESLGQIPTERHIQLMHLAKEHGVDLTPHDLIFGREVFES